MPTKAKTLRLDVEILAQFEHYCVEERKKPTAVVQELILDLLKREGFWPSPRKGK